MSARKPRTWRHKPGVTTEAEPWTGVLADLPDEWLELDMVFVDAEGHGVVRTLKGLAPLTLGDYIARGSAAREFYVIDRAIHRAIYESTEGDQP
jgi:hypothetical protein